VFAYLKNKWILIAVSSVLLIACYEWRVHLHAEKIAVYSTAGAAEPTINGQLQSLLASVGGVTGLIGIIAGLVRTIPTVSHSTLQSVITNGKQQALAELYTDSKDIAFRKTLRDAAWADCQTAFALNFPADVDKTGVTQ